MGYHLSGAFSAALYFLTIAGYWHQLQIVVGRRGSAEVGGSTKSLSLNFILMAFFSFYIMFVYGFSLERFNHYLVWPRLIAVALTYLILIEILRDRMSRQSQFSFLLATVMIFIGVYALCFNIELAKQLRPFSQGLMVLITVLIGQGNIHQILLIYNNRDTGAVSLRSHQLTFIKDIGTSVFGVFMGFDAGWPIVLICGTNAISKLVIMYMFRWVRLQQVR